MSQWFSFVRSQEGATASVSVDVGIKAAEAIPAHPAAFLLVRRIEDGADPAPMRELEDALERDLAAIDVLLVATLTMSGSRTLVAYGTAESESSLAGVLHQSGVRFAMQKQDDPAWQLYRTLLPTEEELRA